MFPMQGNQPDDKLYVDDVFSAYTYTGNGSTQTITNGIDLAGDGGMVWIKERTNIVGGVGHRLFDTTRGATNWLKTETTAVQSTIAASLTAFTSSGFSLGANSNVNYSSSANYASWSFRNADRFFSHSSVVKSSGSNATVSFPDLTTLGMVAVKRTDSTGSWYVWHRSLTAGKLLYLEQTAAEATLGHITVSGTTVTLVNGVIADGTYIVYAWAHDTASGGIVQCGSFTTDGSGTATVTLGWEPQYVLFKTATAGNSWLATDSARGMSTGFTGSGDLYLIPNSSGAESAGNYISPNATGFSISDSVSQTYIYLAIRRPNKPPTVGTQVYSSQSIAGNSTARCFTGIGFAPDTVISNVTTPGATAYPRAWRDKLRGTNAFLKTYTADGTTSATDALLSYDMDGISVGPDSQTFSINRTTGFVYSHYFFKRAPGVSDQICTTGTGANKTEAHNLTVAPELWLHKGCINTTEWVWGSSLLANTQKIVMPSPNGVVTDATAWNSTYPTASVISFGTAAAVNTTSETYSTYMWATLAGVSKVFTYTGDGGSGKVIDCGFTTGARFVLIIRTTASTTQDIFVWDTVRGIVAGNDPHLSLNTTAAEVTTDDSIDPDTSGFAVNQVAATNINVNGAVYIGLAYS